MAFSPWWGREAASTAADRLIQAAFDEPTRDRLDSTDAVIDGEVDRGLGEGVGGVDVGSGVGAGGVDEVGSGAGAGVGGVEVDRGRGAGVVDGLDGEATGLDVDDAPAAVSPSTLPLGPDADADFEVGPDSDPVATTTSQQDAGSPDSSDAAWLPLAAATPDPPFFAGIAHPDVPFESFEPVERFLQEDEPAFILYFQDWASSTITTSELDRIADAGHIPVITWEPHDFSVPFTTEVIDLEQIPAGTFDEFLVESFNQIREHDGVVYLRFAHEFNLGADWYPWSVGVNGNTAEHFVAAWQHIVDTARAVDANNIRWVWAPNATNFLAQGVLHEAYPGDGYVDVVGISGYLESSIRDFDTRFGGTIEEIRSFTQRPILIAETAVDARTPDRDRVVCEFIGDMQESGDVVGFVWFDRVSRRDWRIGAALDAFINGLRRQECSP